MSCGPQLGHTAPPEAAAIEKKVPMSRKKSPALIARSKTGNWGDGTSLSLKNNGMEETADHARLAPEGSVTPRRERRGSMRAEPVNVWRR